MNQVQNLPGRVSIHHLKSDELWDSYVHKHPDATTYHLTAWRRAIEKSYGHKSYYVMAVKDDPGLGASRSTEKNSYELSAMSHEPNTVGVLPLFHMKHVLFGNALVSLPFCDYGGLLADDEDTEQALLAKAVELGQRLGVETIELRHRQPLSCLNEGSKPFSANHRPPATSFQLSAMSCVSQTRSHKVRMDLNLPEDSELLFKTFKSKLRSQIRKPEKESLHFQIGGTEQLDAFYRVFSENMRNLGSPVHAKSFIHTVLQEFQGRAKLGVVSRNSTPMAGGMIIGFRNTMFIPWASSLPKYNSLSPNMMLYWNFLRYAADNGHEKFDFGRSTPGGGTYKFKEQWGAEPTPLHWHYFSLNGRPMGTESEKPKFDKAIQYWKKLPVSVTKIIGPMIRKHIAL